MADGKNCFPFTGLGCMADYCVVSHQALIKCPDSMPIEKAALVSCGVTTGCGAAMNRAKCTPGSSCCVVGCGGVGLSAIQGARICGAKQIIAVDMAESKLAAARAMGATHCINPANSTSLVKDIKKLSGGGVDNALECIGLPSTFQTVIDCTKRGGTSVLVGVAGGSDEATFKMNILLGEKNITGSMMGSSVPSVFVPLLCDLYSKGDLLIDELISKFYPLSDAAQAWSELERGANLRAVFVMHELASMAGAQAI
jgi:S-(hydroxymethyl)glutathione dehydrogenase/alcohol dehydrogenase